MRYSCLTLLPILPMKDEGIGAILPGREGRKKRGLRGPGS